MNRRSFLAATSAAAASLVLPAPGFARARLGPAKGTVNADWTPANAGCWLLEMANFGSTTDGYAVREQQLGRHFDGRLHFKRLGTTDVSDMVISTAKFGSIAYPLGAGTQAVYDIASGKDDAAINGFAQACKAVAPFKLFIRLFWEFNLGGSPFYPANYTMNGVSKPGTYADLISAWRRVVAIFRAAGVTNVKFALNTGKIGKSFTFANAYPGSDVVDWIWEDAYPNIPASGGQRLDAPPTLLDPWYTAVKGYGKPLGIGEMNVHPVDDPKGNYVAGITPLRRSAWWPLWVPALKQRPLIRLVTIFEAGEGQNVDHNWVCDFASQTPNDSGAQAFAAYKAFALDPYMNP